MKSNTKPMPAWPGFILLACLFLLPAVTATAVTTPPKLDNNDCVKCHSQPPADIEAKGLAHKTEIGCQDCHDGHPPTVRKIIPVCSQCHSGSPHFELQNCKECHTNPHTPKVITYGKNVTSPCLTCHEEQIKQLKETPSKHTKLYCSTCHDTHGKIPACTQCHKPHAPEMVAGDCKKCHQAHMPTAVTYKNDQINNADCGACHKKAVELLAASPFKHKAQSCSSCHADKHKVVPACQSCHGEPHPQLSKVKFPSCGVCHSVAHDLYNFPPAKKPQAPPKATTKTP